MVVTIKILIDPNKSEGINIADNATLPITSKITNTYSILNILIYIIV